MRYLREHTKINARREGTTLEFSDPRIMEAPMIYMTGNAAVLQISDTEKTNLGDYLKNGGFLYAEEIRLLVPDQPRACSYELLEAAVPDSFAGKVIRSTVADEFPRSGWPAARGNPTVVTGSIYLIGEILARLEDDVPQSPFSSLQDWH